MTKERRLAIEIWEQIVRELENENRKAELFVVVNNVKRVYCLSNNLNWKHNCWFCQYVRRDYRPMKSREDISKWSNGCQKCPLYKEKADILDDGDCGCTTRENTLWKQVVDDGDVSAAKRIVELLKGGHDESK